MGYLICGGAGFIGSHLVEKLVKDGYDIVVIDNLSRGKIENLNSVINDITFIQGDITNFDLINDSVRKADVVYHLAALSRVIPLFIDKCLKRDDLIVYGGNQVLDFVYISDVVDALLKAVDMSNDNDKFNVGSGVGVKIIELAELIKGLINTNLQIIIKNPRKGEVEEFIADISKIKNSLGWRPKIKLEEGLNDTINRIVNKKWTQSQLG